MSASWPLVIAVQQLLVVACVLSIVVPRARIAWRLRRSSDGHHGLRVVGLLWGCALVVVSAWHALLWIAIFTGWPGLPPLVQLATLVSVVWAGMDVAALASLWLYWRRA